LEKSAHDSAEQEYQSSEDSFSRDVGIVALDDHTMQVRLKRPTPYFLDLLCLPVAYPVHRPTVEGWTLDSATQAKMHERGWKFYTGVVTPDESRLMCSWDTTPEDVDAFVADLRELTKAVS